jgi:hypothetical protein
MTTVIRDADAVVVAADVEEMVADAEDAVVEGGTEADTCVDIRDKVQRAVISGKGSL